MGKLSIFHFIILISIILNLIAFSQCNFRVINHGPVNPKIISGLNSSRNRRSDESLILIELGNWTLRTISKNSINFSPDFHIYHVNGTSTRIIKNSGINCKNLEGRINDLVNSSAIVTICDDNFYVILRVEDRQFVVEPKLNGSYFLEEVKFDGFDDVRVRGKRWTEVYNLTGDTFELNGEIDGDFDGNEGESSFSDHTWTRTRNPTRVNEAANWELSERWLELGIAVDYSVVEFHGDRVQQYVLALLNIVGAIYRDPSLGAELTLVVVRMFFYTDKKDGMVQQGNARKSLENVNKWNRKILSLRKGSAHDVAVWLTRLDIGGPSGYAPVSGACDPARSCALNRDEGLTSAFIIAHELAHILGLTHDGDETAENYCETEAAMGSVMAPMVAATFHRFHWSPCSRKEFHRRAKQWKCLNNRPNMNNVTQLESILDETFTMDEQCRMEFGEGYELCRSLDRPNICSHLWCGHKNSQKVCKTKKGPPLEGTPCGKNQWCINGFCETIDRTKFALQSVTSKPRDVGWSTWSPWGKCSRTCGVGVRLRYRHCNEPLSAFGSDCDGSTQEFRICEQSDCPSGSDLRQEQCSRLSNVVDFERNPEKHKLTLLPHETNNWEEKCKLICRSAETNKIYGSDDFLIDGTSCAYGESDICIQGKCHKMGCDSILNSSWQFDACGVCNGDNSTCIITSNKFQRKIRRATTRIAVIPKDSHNISVDFSMNLVGRTNESIKILIRDGNRRKHEALFDYIIVEGTLFNIQRLKNRFLINGTGPTTAKVIISILIPETVVRGSSVIVFLKYLSNTEKEAMIDKYSWFPGGWGPCTVSCGSGVRQKTTACRNENTERIVHKKKCSSIPKPDLEVEKCNVFSCEFKWIVGPWESCTKTCGAFGIQQRQLYCVHSSFPSQIRTKDNEAQVYKFMLPPNLCKDHQKPDNQRGCNRIMCIGTWIFTDWSPCSQSCGHGVQSRMARCIPPEDETLFNCTGTKTPDELRPCRGNARRNSSCETFCKNDKSRYCLVPNLKKYCSISEFRKNCCRSCMQY